MDWETEGGNIYNIIRLKTQSKQELFLIELPNHKLTFTRNVELNMVFSTKVKKTNVIQCIFLTMEKHSADRFLQSIIPNLPLNKTVAIVSSPEPGLSRDSVNRGEDSRVKS